MLNRRTGIIALTAALLAGAGASVATAQTSAVAAPAALPGLDGIAHLGTQVSLPPGVWTNIPVQVFLPTAGTYDLDANVRGRLAGIPSVNTFITARLWNATAGAEVPQSERLVYQVIDGNAGTAQAGGNATAPIDELITVTGPTTIVLQATSTNAVGAASIAQIYSDGYGYTSLRYDVVL